MLAHPAEEEDEDPAFADQNTVFENYRAVFLVEKAVALALVTAW